MLDVSSTIVVFVVAAGLLMLLRVELFVRGLAVLMRLVDQVVGAGLRFWRFLNLVPTV